MTVSPCMCHHSGLSLCLHLQVCEPTQASNTCFTVAKSAPLMKALLFTIKIYETMLVLLTLDGSSVCKVKTPLITNCLKTEK